MPSWFKWSKTASANANSDPDIQWPEGQLPGTVNNSARSEMAGHANFRDDQGGQLTTAGTQPAYTLATNSGLTALADGVRLAFVCHSTNTAGAATLNVDTLGAKALRKGADLALAAGDLVANAHYEVRYDASANGAAGAWLLPSAPGSGETVTGAFALTGDLTPAQITADQDNYAPTGHATASVFRLSSDASRNITGMAGGSDGLVRVLQNIGSNPLILKDENAGSTAGNRFALESDLRLLPDQAATIIFDATSSRWRLDSYTSPVVVGDAGSGGIKGLVPAAASGDAAAKKFLAASGLFAVPLGLQRVTTFTAGGTWTKQAGLTGVLVFVTGGGGGGSRVVSGSLFGGAAGGTAIKYIAAASLGATETVTIGAAGAGRTGSDGSGTAGTASSFGAHCSGNGGAGGVTGGTSSSVLGGTATGGDVNLSGANGVSPGGGAGGASSFWGGGGGGSDSTSTTALNATSYGSGGGASGNAGDGGNGFAGLVVVFEFGG